MFPTLSDFIKYLTGLAIPLPFPTFGFFMFLAFLAAYWAFSEELKRYEKAGLLSKSTQSQIIGEPASPFEIFSNGFFGFFIGFKLPFIISNYADFSQEPTKYIFSWSGNWIAGIIGFMAFGFWVYYEKNKTKLPEPEKTIVEVWPHELMQNTVFIAAVAGILGAKLFDNLENWDIFIKDPIGNMFSASGLTFYGGLILGGGSVLWYMNKNGVKPLRMLDIGAPGMMVAYSVGRIGCQMAGDGDWGIVNTHAKPGFLNWLPDWTWSFTFPHNISDEGIRIPGCIEKHCAVLPEGVYPTSFYETLICLFLFFILWSVRKKIKKTGMLFFIYLIMNGSERFLIELIRVNTRYHLGSFSFTQAELISSLLFISGCIGYLWVNKKVSSETIQQNFDQLDG